MTEEDTRFDKLFDESSRRSFMKKGAVASGAVALGVSSGSGSVAGQQEPSTALVFVNDFRPDVEFEVVNRLQQGTVDQILGEGDGDDGDAPVNDPADYNGYVAHYTECGPGNYNLVFVRDGSLQSDQSYTFGMDANFFSTQVQLLEVSLDGDGGGGN